MQSSPRLRLAFFKEVVFSLLSIIRIAMNKNLKGLIFIIIGVAILFPQIFNKELVKVLLAVFLIMSGLLLLLGENGKQS